MSSARARLLALLGILALALLLRGWGLHWGLPNENSFFSYHGGESRAVALAMQMDLAEGDIEPRWRGKPFFKWGSHYPYSVHLVMLGARAAGAFDFSGGLDDWSTEDFRTGHLIARSVSVAYALATVLLLYALARRWYGPSAALLAALFFALCPLAAVEAHFATVNSCLTFWSLAAVGVFYWAARNASGLRFLASGVAVGLTLAVKLSSLLLFGPAGLAVLVGALAAGGDGGPRRFWSRALRWGALVFVGAAMGFAAASPYSVLRWSAFWEQAHEELFVHSREGHGLVFAGTGNGLVFLVFRNLPVGLGWALWALALAGIAWMAAALTRGLRRREWASPSPAFVADLLVLGWVALNVITLGNAETRFLRYLLPVCPFLCLAAARFTTELHARLRPGAGALALRVLAVLAVGYTAAYTTAHVLPFRLEDSRDSARRWFFENVPAGSSVALVRRPSNLVPTVHPWNARADRRAGDAPPAGPQPEDYRWLVLDWDPDVLERERPEYVVMNPIELLDLVRVEDPGGLRLARLLEEDYEVAARWQNPTELLGVSFAWDDPPRGWSAPTMEIRILQRRP